MTTFNSKGFISEAIKSILNQSFADFELIIVNTDSSDRTRSIISSYKDKRIHLFDYASDYVQSLNMGLKVAKGKYIARMDADDIAHADRLKINIRSWKHFRK